MTRNWSSLARHEGRKITAEAPRNEKGSARETNSSWRAETPNRWFGRLAWEWRLAPAGMNPFIEPSSRVGLSLACVEGSGHRRAESYLTPRPQKKSNHAAERVTLTGNEPQNGPKGVKMYRHALMGSCCVLFVSLGILAALPTMFLAQGAPQDLDKAK